MTVSVLVVDDSGFFRRRLSEMINSLSGFKVAFKDRNVYLDYTGEAIAEALGAFLRPELAKTVSAIAREQQTNV